MTFAELEPLLVSVLHVAAATAVTIDAVLRKRHVPSIIGWVGLAWLAPVVGSALYLWLGINRIQRTGASLRRGAPWSGETARHWCGEECVVAEDAMPCEPALAGLARLGGRLTGQPLLSGNRVEPLRDGDEAFPAMLAAIDAAKRTITFATYIFDSDDAGRAFLEALVRARDRGVQIRVLIDAVGARYSRASMVGALKRAGVPVAAFLPTLVPMHFRYANLRNHRKILVVDGEVGFTGGMNIRLGHWLGRNPSHPVRCLHFRIEGPVVADLQATFATDWAFVTREHLRGEPWFTRLAPCGSVMARGIPDGPDASLDNMLHVLLGALAVARRRVRIVTPYFLPDGAIIAALKATALRGVQVDIVLPSRSNLPLMDWAMTPQHVELLERGCRVHLTPAPFDHTKLMVIDECWSLVGSTNWDARSLRLNFEYNVECYDPALASRLDALAEERIASARHLTIEELRARPFGARLRDGLARLLSPYL